MQVSASSLGVSPVQAAYGELIVKQQHMLVATYGMVKPDEAVIMTHAHTFDGRYKALLAHLIVCSAQHAMLPWVCTCECMWLSFFMPLHKQDRRSCVAYSAVLQCVLPTHRMPQAAYEVCTLAMARNTNVTWHDCH